MNTYTQDFNAALFNKLAGVQAGNSAVTIYQFDVAALFSQVLANPQSFGLTNVTTPAAPGLDPGDTSYNISQIAANPNEYLFWDELHPTARVHAILGQRAVQMFYSPGDFNHDSKVDAADYLVWRKGAAAGYIQSDYEAWHGHFGGAGGSGNGSEFDQTFETAVPEPSTIALVLTAIGCRAAWRKRGIFPTLSANA